MHMVHTGSDGETPDGRIGDFVHSAITTVRNAAGTVLGGLQQFELLEEVGRGVGLVQSGGIRDGQLAGDFNTCARSVRFLLSERFDGRLWIVPQYSPSLSTTSSAIQSQPTVSESPSTDQSESTPAKRR